MKKTILKVSALALTALTAFGTVACGGGSGNGGTSGGGNKDDSIEITIYAGGSSEYKWEKGAAEEEVYKAIQDAYYEDMGKKLKFNTQFFQRDMKKDIQSRVQDGSVDVVISHVGGGDGLDDWLLDQPTTLYRDLFTDFDKYKNLGKWMKWSDGNGLELDAMDRVTRENGEIIGIPSVISPYKFGILVRKDWMEACGYTDDPTKTDLTLVDNYVEFENMAMAMQKKYKLDYAISGAIFEVEKTGILGAYGLDAGYYSMTTKTLENGTEITDYGGYIDPEYSKVLEVESRWIQNKVLAIKPDAIQVAECEEKFIAGSTGIFMQGATIDHLIEVARACKEVNKTAEFTVLSGLTKDKDSTEKGSMRNPVGTFMASVTANTPDAKELLTFLNWVYKNEDNYNLCRYGVEGVHWIKGENNTYTYPEKYSYHNKPYSGILTLVENQVISNMQYGGLTAEEKQWIETVSNPDNYIKGNDTVDYLLRITNADLYKLHTQERKTFFTYTQNVWGGAVFTEAANKAEYAANVAEYIKGINGYAMEVNELYKKLKGEN